MTVANQMNLSAMVRSEHLEQTSFFDYVSTFLLPQYPEVHPLMFAVPNGVPLIGDIKHRSKIINYLKAEGMTPGVADVLFLSARGGHFGLALEFKRTDKEGEKGNGLSEGQVEFLDAARMEGFKTAVAFGDEHGRKIVQDYLAQPKTQDMIYQALKAAERGDLESTKNILKEVTLAW
jgi:hypothetical protein